MVIDSGEAVSMQLQFNNSPLGGGGKGKGGGGIKLREGDARFFFLFDFFYVAVVFSV